MNTLQHFHVCERSETDYPEFWGIVRHKGTLYVVPVDYEAHTPLISESIDWAVVEDRFQAALAGLDKRKTFEPVGVGVFTHVAFNNPSREYYVDCILDEVARLTGIPAAVA